jgi:hypothetical protein
MTETGTRAQPRRIALLVRSAALLIAVTCAVSSAVASQPQSFDPITFFTGATDSTGSLKQAFSSAKATHVTGFGSMRGNGVFVLDQTMNVTGQSAQSRQWQLHQISPGHFGGSISDGKGPVTIDVAGNRLLIGYTMKNGLKVSSVLTIDAGGRTGHNVSTVRKWGMTVANLSETISKR